MATAIRIQRYFLSEYDREKLEEQVAKEKPELEKYILEMDDEQLTELASR
ncbi:hypothetical protein ABES25_14880 [Bacillus gobiensis]